MKQICAWCKKEIYPDNDEENHPISHGICHECFLLFEYKRIPLESLLRSIPFPILLVDENVRVENANDSALNVLQKSLNTIVEKLGGNVLDCLYSSLPEGCGRTIHCAGCIIRNSVTTTYLTGQPVKERESYNYIVTSTAILKVSILISTEKIGDKVLLQINSLTPIETVPIRDASKILT